MRNLILLSALLFLPAAGCGGQGGFVPASPPSTAESFAAFQTKPGEQTVVACDGSEVPLTDVEFIEKAVPGVSRDRAACEVALRKKAAAMAVELGLGKDDRALELAWRRALASVFMRIRFKEEHTATNVLMERWEELYRMRNVRPRFDHKDVFKVVDVQIICCRESHTVCPKLGSYLQCISDNEAEIRQVREALVNELPNRNAEIVKSAVTEWQMKRFPHIAFQEYAFQYDMSLPHEQQKGYEIVNENVARSMANVKAGEFGPVVQSNFGWHVLYLKEFLPETHKTPEDPEVLAVLQSEYYPQILIQDVQKYLQDLSASASIKLYEEALRDIDWAEVVGK